MTRGLDPQNRDGVIREWSLSYRAGTVYSRNLKKSKHDVTGRWLPRIVVTLAVTLDDTRVTCGATTMILLWFGKLESRYQNVGTIPG